jgi:hypothetical protein
MTAELVPISVPPEAHSSFRRGQLLVLLEHFERPIALDRLGYVEFFAANPFLVWREDSSERSRLQLAGMNPKALSYQATAERYANRRVRLRSDLGALAAWGYLRTATVDGLLACELTEPGRSAAGGLQSLYADAYRLSVSLVLTKMRNVTNRRLGQLVQHWLQLADMRIDLLDTDFEFEADLQGRLL